MRRGACGSKFIMVIYGAAYMYIIYIIKPFEPPDLNILTKLLEHIFIWNIVTNQYIRHSNELISIWISRVPYPEDISIISNIFL